MKDAVAPGDAARRLGVSTRTVQRWLRDGRLPAVRIGGRLKVAAGGLPSADGAPGRPIRRLMVANRGELVVRIARTCRQLGITSLALVSGDQARAWWTSAADERVPLAGTYLDAEAVLAAAARASADAIHPGYGFLAESADFADAVAGAGLTWVGPPAAAMRALGDKREARRLAARLGVPIVPGYDGTDQSDAALSAAARDIGFPLLVKPSAGGGGKGMHVVSERGTLEQALATARREARAAFGDDRLILERYVGRARHVEVQLLCDRHGNAVHLGERECSLQRRHQKVVEEAPSPAVGARLRQRLGAAAIKLARAAGYVGAGTAEFLLAGDGSFYFLELNARLQVEHPVTELVTGRDLVADQLRIAAGEPLGFSQKEVSITGHAAEARLYAEDPWHDFLPTVGSVVGVRWPEGPGLRVDAGIGAGDVVGTRYDPLLAKLIAAGDDRASALTLLGDSLAATAVVGLTTNRGFLRWLVERADVVAGDLDTELIDREWQPPSDGPTDDAWAQAAAALASQLRDGSRLTGFRLNAPSVLRVQIGDETRSVAVDPRAGDDIVLAVAAEGRASLDVGGMSIEARLAAAPTPEGALRHAAHGAAASDVVRAPMPGTVLEVRVSAGQAVTAGQVLLVLEAMKMENTVASPAGATVGRVLVVAGQQVQRGEALVELG